MLTTDSLQHNSPSVKGVLVNSVLKGEKKFSKKPLTKPPAGGIIYVWLASANRFLTSSG